MNASSKTGWAPISKGVVAESRKRKRSRFFFFVSMRVAVCKMEAPNASGLEKRGH